MVERIGYTRPVATPRPLRRTGSVSAAGFAEALAKAEGTGSVDEVEAPSAIGGVSALGGLLGAQEVDEREAKRRKASKQARLTLDVLTSLRDALLIGNLPYHTISQLEALVQAQRIATDDPVLIAIINEIEVRAAVELAKLEMSGLTGQSPTASPLG